MSFPNTVSQESTTYCPACKTHRAGARDGRCGCGSELVQGPIWRPVAGKPGIYVHDDRPECEVRVWRSECADCRNDILIYDSACGCPDHAPSVPDEERLQRYETCHGCGHRMTRLEIPTDGTWPQTTREKQGATTPDTGNAAEVAEANRRRAVEMAKLYDV